MRLKFGMRWLLMVLVVIGLLLWPVASKFNSVRRQRAAVAEIQRLGGSVQFDYQYNRSFDNYQTGQTPDHSSQLGWLVGYDFFDKAEVVFLQYFPYEESTTARVGDEIFATLADMPHLKRLYIDDSLVTNEGMLGLQRCVAITHLSVSSTDISDEGVRNIAKKRSLRDLNISGTSITDEGLQHLEDMPNLERLYLGGTTITDKGLIHLGKIPGLRVLWISNKILSAEALERFRAENKECQVVALPITTDP